MQKSDISVWFIRLKLIIISLVIIPVYAITGINSSFTDFTGRILSPDQAFIVKIDKSQESLAVVKFNIAPGYYIYKDRLNIKINPPVSMITPVKLPKGKLMVVPDDGGLKKEQILTGQFTVSVPFYTDKISTVNTTLNVSLQGCDGKSVCYPPQHYSYIIKYANSESVATEATKHNSLISKLSLMFNSLYTGDNLTSLKNSNYLLLLLLFFIAGCLISLTPCVYPLYPISLKTISYHTSKMPLNRLLAVIIYIHGIALVFILIGVIAAYFGILLTSLIQSKYLILFMVVILLALAFSMFDFYEIKMPNFLSINVKQGAAKSHKLAYLNIFIVGVSSAIFLGPCVTPPLLVALGFIAQKGNVLFGVLSLYCLTLGMSMPILLLATCGNSILPKSGNWMVVIKYLIGLIIIGLAISLIYPFMGINNSILAIGLALVVVGVLFMLLVKIKQFYNIAIYFYLQLAFLVGGVSLIGYGIINGQNSFNLAIKNPTAIFITTPNVAQLDKILNESTKPSVVDVYASWCVVCNEMKRSTFKDKSIINALGSFTALQLDITQNKAEHYKFLKTYGLYGAPAILIFNSQHKLVNTLLGFVDSKRLKAALIKYANY